MSPRASGLAQHGGSPGWLEESDPTGVIFVRMAVPPAFTVPYRLSSQELPSCELMEFPAGLI
jgi:hypothetical protein